MKLIETDVLVVGAGPAGLTASAFLARAGVKAIGITKYGGTADSQSSHITNRRTAEVLRHLGVERRLREKAMPQDIMGTQIFATSFAGLDLSPTMAWRAGIDRRTAPARGRCATSRNTSSSPSSSKPRCGMGCKLASTRSWSICDRIGNR